MNIHATVTLFSLPCLGQKYNKILILEIPETSKAAPYVWNKFSSSVQTLNKYLRDLHKFNILQSGEIKKNNDYDSCLHKCVYFMIFLSPFNHILQVILVITSYNFLLVTIFYQIHAKRMKDNEKGILFYVYFKLILKKISVSLKNQQHFEVELYRRRPHLIL